MALSLREHRVIHRYIMAFLKINFNLKQNFKTSWFWGGRNTAHMFINGLFINPNYFNVHCFLAVVKRGRQFTQHSPQTLEEYVSFTRGNFLPIVKTWCDWCAIINGYFAFLINSINHYYSFNQLDSINKKELGRLSFYMNQFCYLKLILGKKTHYSLKNVVAEELFPNIWVDAPITLKRFLTKITKVYNTVQAVESEWCPFEHMKQIARLAHIDPQRYAKYATCEGFDSIIKAGEALFGFKHLKCHQCVDHINASVSNKLHDKCHKLHLKTEIFFKIICKLSKVSELQVVPASPPLPLSEDTSD